MSNKSTKLVDAVLEAVQADFIVEALTESKPIARVILVRREVRPSDVYLPGIHKPSHPMRARKGSLYGRKGR